MASDDRNFEKALAQHLRSTPTASGAAPHSNCADAETLAAYHERLLSPGELNAWKTHIASCERCQEILAQLEATDEIPLALEQEQLVAAPVIVMQPAAARANARVSAGAPTAAASAAPESKPAAKQPRAISSSTKRWIAPVGAIAATLLVWVVWHEDNLKDRIVQPSPSVAVSENRRADSAPTPPQNAPNPVLSPAQAAEAAKSPIAQADDKLASAPKANIPVSTANPSRVTALDRDQALSDLRKAAPLKDSFASKTQVGPSNRLQQQSNAANYQSNTSQNATSDLSAALKQDSPSFDSARSRAAAPPPAPQAPAPAAGAIAGYARETDQKKKERPEEKAAEPAPTTQNETVAVDGSAAMLSTSSSEIANLSALRIFPVAGTNVIWKIAEDGRVLRSSNLGETWKGQNTGVNTALLAGSAPSEKVCWLAGAFGTVVVTQDSGAHWTRHSLPILSPIDRITAFDARHAIVTLQSTTIQFETFDSGETWSRLTKK